MKDISDHLVPEERRFLLEKGYDIQQDVFGRDICSSRPNSSGCYNRAVSMVARLLGYRDHWDRSFQRARKSKILVLQ
jgi:hypothetical protein